MRRPAGVWLSFIPPVEPELVDRPPTGDGWSHEAKMDGSRTQPLAAEAALKDFREEY